MRIIIRGVCSNSGFGMATQGLIKLAIKAGYETRFIPIEAHIPQHRKGFVQKDLDFLDSISINPFTDSTKDDILIDVGSLIYCASVNPIPCAKKIAYTTYETIKICEFYMDVLNNRFDEIWTASNFNKATFVSSGVNKPVKVIPHYLEFGLFSKEAKPFKIKNKRGFTFVCNADLSFRKGIHLLIPAFIETFKPDDDVCLLLKLMMSNPEKNKNVIVESLNRLLFIKGMVGKPRPPILLMVDYISAEKIPSLYTSADCYVGPSLGEGFSYAVAESMACGLPQISPRCAAPIDYLDKSCCLFVDLDKTNPTIPIKDEWMLRIDPRYKDQKLYNPSYDSLKEKMKYAFEHKSELKQLGDNSITRIKEYLDDTRLIEILKGLING